MIYCCWCDEEGKVIDDGTISRLEENVYRWTAADPSLRWFRQNGLNMDVQIEDISEKVAALALQGPTSAQVAEGRGRSRRREPEIFSRDARQDRRCAGRYFADRLHGRPRLRDLDAVERCGEGVGRADATRAGNLIFMPRACWRWTWRALKQGCCSLKWTTRVRRKR